LGNLNLYRPRPRRSTASIVAVMTTFDKNWPAKRRAATRNLSKANRIPTRATSSAPSVPGLDDYVGKFFGMPPSRGRREPIPVGRKLRRNGSWREDCRSLFGCAVPVTFLHSPLCCVDGYATLKTRRLELVQVRLRSSRPPLISLYQMGPGGNSFTSSILCPAIVEGCSSGGCSAARAAATSPFQDQSFGCRPTGASGPERKFVPQYFWGQIAIRTAIALPRP